MPRSASGLGLSSIGRRVSDGIIKPVRISAGRVDKSVGVFFYVHGLEQHVFEISRLSIFDEYTGGAIKPPTS